MTTTTPARKPRRTSKPPKGADPILWHSLQTTRAALDGAEREALKAARDARRRGMSVETIAKALGMSRATLYRKLGEGS